MSNRNILIITVAVLLIAFLVGRTFYEKIEINICHWYEDYRFNSKEPYGAWLFYEMINNRFGEENVLKNTIDTSLTKIEDNGYLYILLSNSYYGHDRQIQLKEFVSKGNEVLLIGETYFSQLTEVFKGAGLEEKHDSTFNMYFVDDNIPYTYKNYRGDITDAKFFSPRTTDITGRKNFTGLGMINDSTTFFYRKVMDEGTIYHHSAPFLFSNIAGKQDFYLPHFEKIMSNFENKKVILDCAYYYPHEKPQQKNRSPIQYILEEKSLRWAYYTFLLTTLSFVFFTGKRKQRVIPVLEKNENTSIQYVDTLSELFMQQDQNEKLVPHLESIFYQKIKQKYFLAPENENFVNLLSRKSRIPEKNINAILNNFKTGGSGYHFSDDQLIMLHRRLEEFYKNAE